MLDTPYYDAEADSINERAAGKVAEHLFIFCGYSPFPTPTINPDARFMQSVLELYKLIKDCSCIVDKKIKVIMKGNPILSYAVMEHHISVVLQCRSVIAHNNDPNKGPDDRNRINEYKEWVKSVIKADDASNNDDYDRLFREIMVIASKIFSFICDFIDAAGSAPNKGEIIKAWEDELFNWFGINHSIFMGQLADLYLAKAASLPGFNRDRNMWYRHTCGWIERYYFHEIDKKIDNLKDLFSTHSKRLDKKGLKELKRKIDGLIKEEDEKRERKRSEIAAYCRKEPGKLEPFDYRDYFMSDIEKKLRNTYARYSCSLLPQELMQLMIDDCFRGVPIN